MSTDEGTTSTPVETPSEDAPDGAPEDKTGPDWWHRDHPVFSALSGFFTGLLTVIVVPGAFAAILNALFTYERAEDFFPFVLLIFVVPIGLIAATRTRRFGKYMLLGMVLTAVVVVGVAALVLWLLYRFDS
jgi:4-amino-4-deoxy-L-arabinose transferase-like glycosyltransferase